MTFPKRFLMVDALRGVACLAVLFHHLVHSSGALCPVLIEALPAWMVDLSSFGMLGVQIFFVLSGFVIAHSVRSLKLDGPSIANFALRRQVRLDPPYWVVLSVTLAYLVAEKMLPGTVSAPLPTAPQVLMNLVYLQKLIPTPTVVGVAWTLCLEVQFYLFFILLLAFLQRRERWRTGTVAATAIASVLLRGFVPIGLFVAYWFFFCAGVLSYWAGFSRFSARGMTVVFGLIGLGGALTPGVRSNSGWAIAAGILAALTLFGAARLGKLEQWSGGQALQFFGRISYSLYLVHLLVVQVTAAVGFKLTGNNAQLAFAWIALSVLVSIAAAWILHRFVELPSMRLASKLKREAV